MFIFRYHKEIKTKEMTKQDQLQIAATILNQLGGKRFTSMTGSHTPVALDSGLRITLRRNAANAKWLYVELNSMDTYDIRFTKFNKKEYTDVTVKEFNGVYGDQLQKIFTEVTGLYTKL